MNFLLYYLGVGYALNNILALLVLYGDEDGEAEIDFPNFILTIPAWPYTLYQVIGGYFNKE